MFLADVAAYTQSYVSPSQVPPGPNLLTVTFYAGRAGAGAVVGTASKAINIAEDGTGAGDVLLVGNVQKVAITSPSKITVGQSADLGLSATDGNGSAVAVSTGSAIFTLVSGGEAISLTPDGKLTAKAVGVAKVTASLDGKTSEPFSIEVRAPGPATAVIAAGYAVVRVTVAGTTSEAQAVFVGPGRRRGPGRGDAACEQLEAAIAAGADVAFIRKTETGALRGTQHGVALNAGERKFATRDADVVLNAVVHRER